MRSFIRKTRMTSSVIKLVAIMLTLVLTSGCCRTSGWVMNNSGMGYYQKGNYSMARNEFERAVMDSPRNPDYRHNLGMAMQKQGDMASAETVLRHNLSVDPMHQPTYHALTQILISQQRTAEAEQLLTGWRDSQPYVPEAHIEHAWFEHEVGNRAAAEQDLRQALQIKPNHPVALAQLGQLYHESGQADQAANFYQRSLQSRWSQPEVRSRLATVTGRTSTSMNRSALMQNDAVIQTVAYSQGGAIDGAPMISQNGIPLNQAVALDDYQSGRRHRHRQNRHKHGSDDEPLPLYPLPTYGLADSSGFSGIMTSAMPTGPGIVTSPTPATDPTLASQLFTMPPTVSASPTPILQTDPSHATDVAAGLPIVDPH